MSMTVSESSNGTSYSVRELRKIPASGVDDELLIRIFSEQIKKMAFKYRSMAVHSVGGTIDDLVSTLNLRALYAFRDWRERIASEGSISERTALDIVKFISCRLRTYCIDLARYQRDHVEPAFQMFDHVNPEDEETPVYHQVEVDMWSASLNETQKKVVEIWKEGAFYNRKDPIKALVREASRRLKIKENILLKEIRSIPQF